VVPGISTLQMKRGLSGKRCAGLQYSLLWSTRHTMALDDSELAVDALAATTGVNVPRAMRAAVATLTALRALITPAYGWSCSGHEHPTQHR
jgi:hypothetical protein